MLNIANIIAQLPAGNNIPGIGQAVKGGENFAGQGVNVSLADIFASLVGDSGNSGSADLFNLQNIAGKDSGSAVILQSNPQIATLINNTPDLNQQIAQNNSAIKTPGNNIKITPSLEATLNSLKQQLNNTLPDLPDDQVQQISYAGNINNGRISAPNPSDNQAVQEILAKIPNNVFAQSSQTVTADGNKQINSQNQAAGNPDLQHILQKTIEEGVPLKAVISPEDNKHALNNAPKENPVISIARNPDDLKHVINSGNKNLPGDKNNFGGNSLFSQNNNAISATSAVSSADGNQNFDHQVNNVTPVISETKSADMSKIEQYIRHGAEVRHYTPAEQVQMHIANALKGGDTKIHVQLDPAFLGKVDIQIEMPHNGSASVSIVAEKQETLDMLRNDSRSLEKALQDAGVKTNLGSLNFGLKQGEAQQQFANQERAKAYKNASLLDNDMVAEAANKTRGIYLIYNTNRALDIRV